MSAKTAAAAVAPGAARKLPVPVRVMRRLSARGLPPPVCEVAVETGIGVPAGDGVTLLTDHYLPLLAGPQPTLLIRSPYGRGFPWNYLYGALFAGQGFHVVIQSCRGTGGSGGAFEPWRNEAADGQAAVAWLRGQPWFNGALGTIGPSYLGYVQWALAASPPPELRAMVVQVGAADLHGFLYRGGAFLLEDALVGTAAMVSMARGTATFAVAILRLLRHHRRAERELPLIDACPPALGRRAGFFGEWLTHPAGDDPYWDGMDYRAVADRLAVPVSLVSGWYDTCLDQTLAQYRRLRDGGCQVSLLLGPWTHTSAFDKGLPEVFPDALAWLREHLCGERSGRPHQPARVYVGGCREWRELPDWPPPAVTRTWYPDSGGQLRTEPPARQSLSSFRYDPADPTPSAGGPVMNSRTSGAVPNKALEARADVLVFTSEPLAGPLEVIGPVSARLQVRGSSPNFDVFARLCDVSPDGDSRNVCDGLLRLPAASPGQASASGDGWSAITVAMSSAAHRFLPGHRLRLQISGGAHPRFARNSGTGEPLATATSLRAVDIQIRHGGPSCGLMLPVTEPVPADQR